MDLKKERPCLKGLYKMKINNYFLIGQQVFAVHSDFMIPWTQLHKRFLVNSDEISKYSIIHYYVKCYEEPLDVSKFKVLYRGKNQYIYQGEKGELRVHYLLGTQMSFYCEQIEEDFYIWIDPVVKKEAYMYFVGMMLEKVLLDKEGLILHSSYITDEKEAILFTGPSGIGKSTQADLWKEVCKTRIINGDRTLLQKYNDTWYACGFPICGSSDICFNEQFPIKAIVYLSQGSKNTVERITGFKAFSKIASEISINYWNQSSVDRAFSLIEDILEKIPIYHLSCTPTKEAVDVLQFRIEEG